MVTAYKVVIAGLLGILGLLLFPTLHGIYNQINMSSWLPLTAAAATFLPYALLLFVVYIIFKMK